MTTVQQHIVTIANKDGNPQLSKRDFLLIEANHESLKGCQGDLRCGIFEIRKNNHDMKAMPDHFVQNFLGKPGSYKREIAEKKADFLLAIAKRYKGSQEIYSDKSAFNREIKLVENIFDFFIQVGARLFVTVQAPAIPHIIPNPVRTDEPAIECEVGCCGPLQYDEPYRSQECCGDKHCK